MTFLGIALIILGVIAIAAPLVTGISIALLLGALLLMAGIAKIVWAFRDKRGIGAMAWGGLTLLTGIIILAQPGVALASLTLVFATYFFVSGIFEAWIAIQSRPAPGWVWALVGGVVSVILAIMIWTGYPTSAAWLVGTLVGIKLIFAGMTVLTLKHAVNKVKDAVGDALGPR
jgi:uncharacterized membrane protein HdeD (DUF308 family)